MFILGAEIILLKIFNFIGTHLNTTIDLSSIITLTATLIGFGITIFLFFRRIRIEEKRIQEQNKLATQEKIFDQIKLTLKRIINLIEKSNNNLNWVAAYRLLGYATALSNKIEDPGIIEAYQLEEIYYQRKISNILHSAYGFKYFFGLSRDVSDTLTETQLYEMTTGNTSELRKYRERRSDEKIPYRISPRTLIYFMRFILKNETYNGQPICKPINSETDITESEEIIFREFSSVISYIDTIRELNKRTYETGKLTTKQLESVPIE